MFLAWLVSSHEWCVLERYSHELFLEYVRDVRGVLQLRVHSRSHSLSNRKYVQVAWHSLPTDLRHMPMSNVKAAKSP